MVLSAATGGVSLGAVDLARFAEIVERLQDGFYTIDREWRFLYANRRACELWGTTAETVIGRVLWERFPAIVGTRAGQQLRDAVASGAPTEFETLSPVIGRWLWLRVDPIEPDITAVYWRDITQRKQLEDELRRLTEQLEARIDERTRELAEANDRLLRERRLSELIIENAAEGIIVIDREMRHIVWNAAMEGINGLARNAVLGRTVFELFPHLADHPTGQAWRDALAGRASELRDRRYFASARGQEIVYDADFAPLYDQDRAIIGALCIVRETTERHRMEEMLRQSQKMEAVAQLTGGVAHDFNNLLTAVIGCLDMIAHESRTGRIRNLPQTALRSAGRGARLTQQLLAFARRQALKPIAADLNTLLAEMEILLRRAVGETIELRIERGGGLWPCQVDTAQFEAAVMNLVMNARDAMPKGGWLSLETRNVEATHLPDDAALPQGDYVALAVRDSGEGMAAEVKERAFDPFYTTKEIGKGSGLGLSMVYGFAQQSGGGVRLESAPGQGTCVTLYLPRAPTIAAALSPGEPDALPPAGSGTILVVEDDDSVREMSVNVLEARGYRVIVARNGPEAFGILRHEAAIDVLFSDVVMPHGLSGVELARRARELRPGLKVLLTSGYSGDAASSGEFPLLAKPFRPSELTGAVAQLMKVT